MRAVADIQWLCFTILGHPPYSPAWHCQISITVKLKEIARGHHYTSDSEVKTVVKLWFCHQDAQLYHDRLMKLLEHCKKCVELEGGDVEK